MFSPAAAANAAPIQPRPLFIRKACGDPMAPLTLILIAVGLISARCLLVEAMKDKNATDQLLTALSRRQRKSADK
jgi:hypothetical protein